MKPRLFRIVEKVTFNYIYVVEATSPDEARALCDEVGDGEAIEHTEVDRRFVSTGRFFGKPINVIRR